MAIAKTTAEPRWATIATAAKHSGLSVNTIRHMIARGKLRKYKPTRRVLVDLSELDRHIKASVV
jgi:excisionase family DNA binding protein